MKGSNIALSVADRPSRMPSGRPTTIAKASPTANAAALTPSGDQIEPVASISHSVSKMRLGTVKKSLVPDFIGKTCGTSSQTTSRSTMAVVPIAIDSMRCRSAEVPKRPVVIVLLSRSRASVPAMV